MPGAGGIQLPLIVQNEEGTNRRLAAADEWIKP